MKKNLGKMANKEKKENQLKGLWHLLQEEDGMGTVEIILIIVVLVGIVLIFKEQLSDIVEGLFDKITNQTKKV